MLENALKYAKLGLKVFPIKEGFKNPATANGFYSATTEESIIRKWWGENPNYNIAIRTGKESGLFSLDVDTKLGKNGFLWLEAQGDLPNTVIQNTPSGGKQYFFKIPDFTVTCNSEKLAEGIDVRGDGGYVLVPPSKLIESPTYKYCGTYDFMTDQALGEIELSKAPEWLLNKLIELIPNESPKRTDIKEESLPIDIKKVMDHYKIELPEIKPGVFQGAHPLHGSSNGANFKIDTIKNVWSCYRHTKTNGSPVGGGILQLIAMMEGIVKCEDCARGSLRGPSFNKVIKALGDNFNVSKESIKREDVHPMYEIAADIRDGSLATEYIYCVEEDSYYFYNDNYWKGLLEGELALIMNRNVPNINKNSLAQKNQIFGHLRIEVQKRVSCFNSTKCLNFKEGEYNPSTNTITPHNKDHYSTTRLSYSYNEDAKCPMWIMALNEILEGDQDKIDTLQEFFGYCLTTEMQLKKALLLLGESDTGKSTVLFIFKELIGEINYSNVSLKNMGHPQYTPMMINKLVNIDTDVDKNASDYEANFKKITAYEEIECNQKYLAAFRFRPECRIILSANIFPKITDHSSAFYNRLIVIPFDRIFSPEEQDPELVSKLRVELPGIFNWCVQGYQRLKERKKFKIHNFSRQMVEELEDANNPSNVFFKEHVEVAMGEVIGKGELFERYKQWSDTNKQWTLSAAMFSNCVFKTFHKTTPKSTQLNGKRVWRNIRFINFKVVPQSDLGYTD